MGVEASAKAEAQNGVWTGTRRHRLLLGRPGGQAQPLRSSGEKSGNVPCGSCEEIDRGTPSTIAEWTQVGTLQV